MTHLPNLIIIGAAKAATTSLQRYLSLHPEIYMSKVKELNFFTNKADRPRSLEWYKSNFPVSCPIIGEASPLYTRYPKVSGVPEKMHEQLGDIKLIYMVRDPVDRLISHYIQVVDQGWERRDFATLLNRLPESGEQYIECSMYFMQIQRYLQVFPRKNIHIVISERLKSDRTGTLKDVFQFLGVDKNFWNPGFTERLNTSDEKMMTARWFNAIAPEWLRQEMLHSRLLPWKVNHGLRRLSLAGATVLGKPRLGAVQDRALQAILMSDVKRLREWLGDPIPEWRPYSETA